MSPASGPQPKVGRRRHWVSLFVLLLLLFFLTSILLPPAIDYIGFRLGYYPESSKSYLCAVCGRWKQVVKHQSRVTGVTYRDSPGTKYADRFIGEHEHVWVLDSTYYGTFSVKQFGDSFVDFKIPIATPGVPRALGMLEETDCLEPVVKALCDVDNYYAYLACDVLLHYGDDVLNPRQPRTRQQLDKWWEQYKQCFVIEHDAERALPVLRALEKREGRFPLLQRAAEQTLEYYDRHGVPTRGAVVSHGLQDKNWD